MQRTLQPVAAEKSSFASGHSTDRPHTGAQNSSQNIELYRIYSLTTIKLYLKLIIPKKPKYLEIKW